MDKPYIVLDEIVETHNNNNFIQQHGEVIGRTDASFASIEWALISYSCHTVSHSQQHLVTLWVPAKKLLKRTFYIRPPRTDS